MKKIILVLASIATYTHAQIAPDNTFNTTGHASLNLNTGSHLGQKAHQQSDGKLILSASAGFGSNNYDFFSVRFNTNGSVDNSYGIAGITTVTFGTTYDELLSSVIQNDDKVILVGGARVGTLTGMAAARVSSVGVLDNSFNTNGLYHNNLQGEAYAYDVALQNTGKVILVGSTKPFSFTTFRKEAIMRLNANGTLDNTFATNGVLINDLDTTKTDEARCVAIDNTQNILVGSGGLNNGKAYLTRITPNGVLDNTFGVNGNLQLSFTTSNFPGIYDIKVQADGKYVIAVSDQTSPVVKSFIARYNTNGTLDNTFNTTGYLALDTIGVPKLVLQADGKIVGVATKRVFTPLGVVDTRVLLRVNANGTFDNTFGNNGIFLDLPKVLANSNGIILQQDGKIVITGTGGTNPLFTAGLSRYNNNLTTSINDAVTQQLNGTIYPNPTSSILNVKLEMLNEPTTLTITNILGEIVLTETATTQHATLSTQHLNSGIYFLQVGNSKAVKFIKE